MTDWRRASCKGWLMARAILERHEEVTEVRMALPNLHHWLVDLSPFGLENDNEIFIATTEPCRLDDADWSELISSRSVRSRHLRRAA